MDFLPTRVSTFDNLITRKGIERGNSILVSGGCGVGKTIFTMQSIYNAAQAGEKGIYITLGEDDRKIIRHMENNFGWDVSKYVDEGVLSVQKVDPFALAEDVSALLENHHTPAPINVTLFEDKVGKLSLLDSKKLKIPFKPDWIVLDSVSSLQAAFMNKDYYRIYLQALIDALNEHESVNYFISETEQDPTKYSKTGVEEFLVDGVIVLYNVRKGQLRRQALEILKLRCSDHVKEMISYMIGEDGIKLLAGDRVL